MFRLNLKMVLYLKNQSLTETKLPKFAIDAKLRNVIKKLNSILTKYQLKSITMKKSILLLLLLSLLISCNENGKELAPTSLAGTWKLTEMLQDPGDGSGTFQPVNSNKKIVFISNNKVTSNGILCDMSINSDTFTTGSYSEATNTINPSDCQNLTINYELNATSLILSYRCIEGCRAKYIKVQ